MVKKAHLALGLPTYTRSKAYKGKGISKSEAKIVQAAARRKKDELSKRLKSKRFRERLAKQGIEVDEDVLKHVGEVVKATPVYATKRVPEGAYGAFQRQGADAGTKTKHRRLGRAKQNVRVDASLTTPRTTKSVTRHELEHAFDESFKDANPGMSLSEVQRSLLRKLGGKGSDIAHTRTDIMQLRDEIGSENVSASTLELYLEDPTGRANKEGGRVNRMIKGIIKENPGVSLKKIADMINSVAIRRKRKKDTRLA